MRTLAPAKINWTLEVLGKREDGYHEIRSVMQTIDLCDELSAELSDSPVFETAKGEPLADDDLIVRAARALEGRVGRALPVRIRVQKRIPVASGLGGGSSDAAAVLRLLNKLYELELSDEELATVGAVVGSDVAFFVYGGTALVEGKGERLTSLRDAPETWVVLIVPPVSPVSKTVSMYESLTEDDFTDGSNTIAAAEEVRHGKVIDDWHMRNVFERAAFECFPDLVAYRYSLLRAGASAVYLAGSGPGQFSRSTDRAGAERIAGNVKAGGGKVIVARTVGAKEATAVTD